MSRIVERNIAVLNLLYTGNATRPQIAARAGMSKPTVSAAIAQLQGVDLIREDGHATGAVGRNPQTFALNTTAAMVVGIDVGGVNSRLAIADVTGTVVAEMMEQTDHSDVIRQLGAMFDLVSEDARQSVNMDYLPLTQGVLSTPGLITEQTRKVHAYNVHSDAELDYSQLESALSVPLRIENNVNAAAIGEMRHGAAQDVESFIYVSVGAGIGIGTVHHGHLIRGVNGAAGEICYLPLGADPLTRLSPLNRDFEDQTAAAGLLHRARQSDWAGEPPRDVADLFARASDGDPVARDLVWDEGVRIGIGLVAARTVIDPRLVVLGGGIGRNELLVEPVRDTGHKLFPIPCDVVTTQLADRGSLIGAITMAADLAWHQVLSDPVHAPYQGRGS